MQPLHFYNRFLREYLAFENERLKKLGDSTWSQKHHHALKVLDEQKRSFKELAVFFNPIRTNASYPGCFLNWPDCARMRSVLRSKRRRV
jgi:hypothetical protein